MKSPQYDVIIVGGGFFGCAIAIELSKCSLNVLLLEKGSELLTRASQINQARIHTGFHYPRSFLTAIRSFNNYKRFIIDFRPAIIDDYQMLYAISRQRSKVSALRFYSMFKSMDAPIERASQYEKTLFNTENIEEVFRCTEYAFNYSILRDLLSERMASGSVNIRLNSEISKISKADSGDLIVHLKDKETFTASSVFNATYSQLNTVLIRSDIEQINLKHELAEIALFEPPAELKDYGITVMDGNFFSMMPFPAKKLHSLTHVRYTPHYSWTDKSAKISSYDMYDKLPKYSRWRHMLNDAVKYVPAIKESVWKESLFEVKTVTVNSEEDDGRPILFQQHSEMPQLFSILGSKIDNIYDLYETLPKYKYSK